MFMKYTKSLLLLLLSTKCLWVRMLDSRSRK